MRLARRGRRVFWLDANCQQPLGPHLDFKRDPLASFQSLESLESNLRIVREEVRTAPFLHDEAKALGVVEPLHNSRRH